MERIEFLVQLLLDLQIGASVVTDEQRDAIDEIISILKNHEQSGI